jgi:hypothetical protein
MANSRLVNRLLFSCATFAHQQKPCKIQWLFYLSPKISNVFVDKAITINIDSLLHGGSNRNLIVII